mgnify:FL=1
MSKLQALEQPQDICAEEHSPSSTYKHTLPLSDDLALDLAEVFGVLADSTRLKIITLLIGGESCVCEIADKLGLKQSTVSHQLRLLRAMRLVKYRKTGRTVYYQLCDDHVVNLIQQTLNHLLESEADEEEEHESSREDRYQS